MDRDKLINLIVLLFFIGAFVVCVIYNWNTPYEITWYGAHGQMYGTGKYTTRAAEFKKSVILLIVFFVIFVIVKLFDKNFKK